jgi:hypothetical protein
MHRYNNPVRLRSDPQPHEVVFGVAQPACRARREYLQPFGQAELRAAIRPSRFFGKLPLVDTLNESPRELGRDSRIRLRGLPKV